MQVATAPICSTTMLSSHAVLMTHGMGIGQGVMPAGAVSEVEALAGGEMLQEWLLHAQGKLRKAKSLKFGSDRLLQALQQVCSMSHKCMLSDRFCCGQPSAQGL